MDIPFLRYSTVSFDQIQRKFTSEFSLFSGFRFTSCSRFSRRKLNFLQINCVSFERGLLKPKPKPLNVDVNGEKKGVELEDDRIIRKPANSSICCQIEKLVFDKRYRDAIELFEILELECGYDVGVTTYDALADACISLRSMRGVKRVFNHMVSNGIELDQYMHNRVLLMHVKCGMMNDAKRLFDEMPVRNLVSWNTIISGLVDSGDYLEAFDLFLLMWEDFSEAGSRTFATMIRASAGLEYLFAGKQLHSCALKVGLGNDIFISCSLIDMYSKCSNLDDAHSVFYDMPNKTTVAWNSIIAGYALNGYSEEALDMYYEMRDSGALMDHFTFSIITRICTRLASLEHAKQAHAGLIRHGFGVDIVANTALVDFYSKWGRVEDARNIFDKMVRKNVISWNAMIAGYGNHGRGAEAVEMFELMVKERMVPNHVTFLAVLSACSYSGLSDCGWEIFESMTTVHNVRPRAMHYACMIDLLGREGRLDKAVALIRDAPFEPTVNMWAALLRACRVHKNFELGKFAAKKVYGMEPLKLSSYILLMNIYNSSGKLKEAASVLQSLKRKGLRMIPACSWIEIKKQPHMFLSRDTNHAHATQNYSKLAELMLEISKHGYVSDKKNLLPDVDEHEQRIYPYHSEKLAVAFGLINTNDSTPLQIVQSHRICNDCHIVIKLIAKVTKRSIVVRDGSRFHHFKDGICSCGDYW